MKFYSKFAALISVVCVALSTPLYAEDDDDEVVSQKIEQLQMELDQVKEKLEEKSGSGFYTPKLFGTIYTTFATSTYDGATRFNVRNTRFGVKGNAAKELSYAMQIDFHNQGSVSVLDAYVKYQHANYDITLGQQQIHLSTDLDRGPSSSIVNSRSYASILSTEYYQVDEYGVYSTSSFGSRDIGAYFNYKFDGDIPVTISAGCFNGLGVNKTEWSHRMNFVTRVMAGSGKSGFRGGASFYWGDTPLDQDISILTAELNYTKNNFFVETLYQQRRLQYDGLQLMQLGLVQGNYKIDIPENRFFSYLTPALRWDWGNDLEYLNLVNDLVELYNVHRLTPQVSLGFVGGKLRSHLAISYEKIFMNSTPSDLAENPLMQDKFTVAFVAAF